MPGRLEPTSARSTSGGRFQSPEEDENDSWPSEPARELSFLQGAKGADGEIRIAVAVEVSQVGKGRTGVLVVRVGAVELHSWDGESDIVDIDLTAQSAGTVDEQCHSRDGEVESLIRKSDDEIVESIGVEVSQGFDSSRNAEAAFGGSKIRQSRERSRQGQPAGQIRPAEKEDGMGKAQGHPDCRCSPAVQAG